tara:strand:+ start:123 stop:734 length:612 start_codon:yes stop_codon:yes gene_type:complete
MEKYCKIILASFLVLFFLVPSILSSKIVDTLEALETKSMGNEEAPLKMLEFASLTCGHCARFHNEVMPVIKEKYIKKGLIHFTYKDFPLDKFALKASIISRCSGNENYFKFLDVFYKKQASWTRTKDPFKSLLKIAKVGGIKDEAIKVCVGNKSIEDGLLKDRLNSSKKYDIKATPTIYLNGEKYEGDLTLEALELKINSILD